MNENDIEWEIEQINIAISYYEAAIRNSSRDEKRVYEKQIKRLRSQLKQLLELV